MFKVIIWATDGSSRAAQALPYAKGLAQAHGAQLIVVHVNEIVAGRGGAGPVNFNEDQVQAALVKHVNDLK
jgi:nucleotide-binding universal stress UspA family protein